MQSYQSNFEHANNTYNSSISHGATLSSSKRNFGKQIINDLLHAESDAEIKSAIRDYLNNRHMLSNKQGNEIEAMVMNNFSVQLDEVFEE